MRLLWFKLTWFSSMPDTARSFEVRRSLCMQKKTFVPSRPRRSEKWSESQNKGAASEHPQVEQPGKEEWMSVQRYMTIQQTYLHFNRSDRFLRVGFVCDGWATYKNRDQLGFLVIRSEAFSRYVETNRCTSSVESIRAEGKIFILLTKITYQSR